MLHEDFFLNTFQLTRRKLNALRFSSKSIITSMHQTVSIIHHQSSMFFQPLKSEKPSWEMSQISVPRRRSSSSCSNSSIDSEFTHFKPIKRAPVHCKNSATIVKPVPRHDLKVSDVETKEEIHSKRKKTSQEQSATDFSEKRRKQHQQKQNEDYRNVFAEIPNG